MSLTIQSAAESWLQTLQTRKRKSAKPGTLATFRSHLSARIQVIASVIDENGDQIYPRKWNSSFLALPIVENQKAAYRHSARDRVRYRQRYGKGVLMLLLAASGMRIGESLAIRTQGSDNASFFADGAVTIRTSMWRGIEQASPKTLAARRTIELARPVAERIASFAANLSGFLFGNGESVADSKPSSQARAFTVSEDSGQPGCEKIECKRTSSNFGLDIRILP